MPTLIGQSLGRYHILEQLGEGGMAVVYKAFDTRLERNVAIKVILPGKEHSDKFLKRFEREAKALASLSHPNIVKVIDYGEHEGLPYLVMEYIPGGTLKHKLGRPIAWQQAVQMLVPIARALAYAHENKIIHRDVKPSNILITQSGEPMLSDFGIAKMVEAEETLDLTGTGVGVGTPEYMSPEQAQGKTVDARSDVYSLGVLFYEMIAGRKPYQADTPMAVVWKQASEPLPRPKEFVRDLPSHVENLLLKALAKKADDRFQDMSAFATMLERLAAGGKVPTTRLPKPARSKRQIRLSPTVIFSGLGIAVLVTGGLILTGLKNGGALQLQPSFSMFDAPATGTPTLSARDLSTANAITAIGTVEAYHATATEIAHELQQRQATATVIGRVTLEAWFAETPIPVETPQSLSDALTLYETDFSSRPPGSEWGLGNFSSVSNGILRQIGREWDSSARPEVLNDHEGVLLEFRCAPQSEAELYLQAGTWNAPGLRRWGIYCNPSGDPIGPNVYRDLSTFVEQEWVGNLDVKPGNWYALLLFVGGSNDFIARVWQPDQPYSYMEMRNTFGSDWAGLQWYFAVAANRGEIDIAEYKEIQMP